MSSFKGVCVGINAYGGDNALQGCVNDVLISRDILKIKHAVSESDIRVILDERATKDAILERLEWLISESKTTKNLFFHYSGHGAQVPNRDYLNEVEFDGMDEVICPFDFDWAKGTWITDDDIYAIISKKNKDSRLVMIFDCCHSGTVYRNTLSPSDVMYKVKARAIDTPLDLLSRIKNSNISDIVPVTSEGERFWGFDEPAKVVEKPLVKTKAVISLPNTIVLSACADYQTAADANFKTRYQGAFSYCLQKFMYKNPDFSVREVEESTKRYMQSFGFSQKPEFYIGKSTNTRKLILND